MGMKPPKGPIKGVIFDLDGTLVDSEPNYMEADRRLMAHYGITFTEEMKQRYVGYGNARMMEEIQEAFQLPDDAATLLVKKNAIYMELAREKTPLFPEMAALLARLRERGLSLAVASGSSPEVIKEVLAQVGILSSFEALVSSEEVKQPKPEPDIFIEAASRLGLEPESLVVVEDSSHGVEAALRAGMPVVAIPTLLPVSDEVFFKAHLFFEGGMRAFTARAFLDWLDSAGS
jgi:beta-phosphoglucomutase family hydrolase